MRYRISLALASTILIATGCAESPVAPQTVRPSALLWIESGTPQDPTPPQDLVPPPTSTHTTATPVSSAGCTRTQGYWKQGKHGWPAGRDRNAAFYSSGISWQRILNAAPTSWPAARGGGVYIQLGYQYIAATLNATRNGGAPAHVASAIDATDAYFQGTPQAGFHPEQAKNLLDRFNNGLEGVPHCR